MKILNIGTVVVAGSEFKNEIILYGPSKYVEGIDYVRSKIIQKLSVIRGELASPIPSYDESRKYGIPYLDKLTSLETDIMIKNAVTSIPEVNRITSWESWIEEGKYHCKFVCETVEGDIEWQI